MKILIVDDDSDQGNLLSGYISMAGLVPLWAGNGSDALKLAYEHVPSLAVVDVHLPDTTGWKLCDIFKHDRRTKEMSLIVQSGSVGKFIGPLAKSYGIEHWISKPYDCEMVVELIQRLLWRSVS